MICEWDVDASQVWKELQDKAFSVAFTWRYIIVTSFLRSATDSGGVLPSDMLCHSEYLIQLSNATSGTWSRMAMAERSRSAETDSSGVYAPSVPRATVIWWSIFRTRVG